MGTALEWADYKFTDRDVRDHPLLVDIARNYLIQYTGDFEFLLDMRRKCEHLTVPQARGVLNCMRNDPRAMTALMEILRRLPRAPELPAANGDGEFREDEKVVPFRLRRTSGYGKKTNEHCDETQPHHGHWTDRNNFCPGIPWAINRAVFALPAKVKRKYAIAKSGTLIHLVARERHAVQWFPRDSHGEGFGRAELCVRLVCRYPSMLRNPVLTDELPEHHWNLKLCPYCIEEVRAQCPELLSSSESESTSPSSPVEETSGPSVASTSRTVPQLVFMQPNVAPSGS
jgi:hypothetical protein